MSSSYNNENLTFSDTLSRPTTSKGSILASDGTDFQLVTPSTDGEILIADSAESSGVKWGSATSSLGFAVYTANLQIPLTGIVGVHYLSNASPVPVPPFDAVCAVFPDSTLISISVNTDDIGYSTIDPTLLTSGTLSFGFGRVAADTQTTGGNFASYNGAGTSFSIDASDINTAANNYRTFSSTLDIDIDEGVQFGAVMGNGFFGSPGAGPGIVNVLLTFRTR